MSELKETCRCGCGEQPKYGLWMPGHEARHLSESVSKIAIWSWMEPEAGVSAEIWKLVPLEWSRVVSVMEWLENYHSETGIYGETIQKLHLEDTWASGGDKDSVIEIMLTIAEYVRYNSGESLYTADCPILKEFNIERS